jgi:predicted CXXCH cytochrome family protein
VRCTICHEPHQATRGKLMRAFEHTPFARKQCDACHRDRAAKIGPVYRPLCLDCHTGKDLGKLTPAPAKVHPPFADEDCAACHRSHNADAAGVLRESQGVLCLNCHRTMRKALLIAPVSAHDAVTEGRCGECHDPHFSDNPSFLRRPLADVCPSCHAAIVRAPDGAAWPQPHKPVEEGKCRLCHKSHTSSNPALLKAPSPQACRPCHVTFFKENEAEENRSRHAPVRDGACAVCHQVHGGTARLLVEGVRRERCVGCHKDLKDAHHQFTSAQLTAAGGEAAVARGCLFCHRPHSSPRPKLLLAADGPCKACHKT